MGFVFQGRTGKLVRVAKATNLCGGLFVSQILIIYLLTNKTYMIDKKQTNISTRTGIIIILSPFALIFLIVLLSPSKSPQTNSIQTQDVKPQNIASQNESIINEDTTDEYGSSLTECLKKADSWFIEATQTAKKTLKEETQGNSYQGFINENASSESEIISSLKEELVDYKKECNNRF